MKVKNKKNKIIFLILLTLGITSCSFPNNNSSEVVLEKLAAPSISGVVDNIIYWNHIENATSYSIMINNSFYGQTSSGYSYSVGAIMDAHIDYNVPTECYIQVKAEGDSSLYLSSDWSNSYEYTYTKISIGGGEENEDILYNWNDTNAQNGIGLTVNAIEDEFIEVSSKADARSIFKNNELYKLPLYLEKNYKQTLVISEGKSVSEYYESFMNNFSSKISRSNGASAQDPSKAFSANIKSEFEASMTSKLEIEKTNKTSEYYASFSQIYYGDKIYISGYSNLSKFTNILSDEFLESARKIYSQKEAAEFFSLYGTHLIAGGIFGGKVNFTYSMVSNTASYNTEFMTELAGKIANSASISITDGMGGSAGAESSSGLEVKNTTEIIDKLKNEKEHINFKISSVGGNVPIGSSFTNLSNEIKEWGKTINDNPALIDVPDESLISLWSLLPDEDDYLEAKSILSNYFYEKCDESYYSILGKYSNSNELGSKQNPYLISDANGLKEYLSNNIEDKYYELTRDIDYEGERWETVDTFNGHLDGKNYTIKNYSIVSTTDVISNPTYKDNSKSTIYSALIGINNGTISNLKIDSASVKVSYSEFTNDLRAFFVSSLVGYNNGSIYNVEITNSIVEGLIDKSLTTGEIYPKERISCGAVAGLNNGEIEFAKVDNVSISAVSDGEKNHCKNYAFAGGITAYMYSDASIKNCIVSNSSIYSKSRGGYSSFLSFSGGIIHSNAGYLVGKSNGTISNCVVYGEVEKMSLKSEIDVLSSWMDEENYAGLLCGVFGGGAISNSYCISDGSKSKVVGNSNNYENYKMESSEDIYEIVQYWNNWNYVDGEFTFTIN